MWEIKSAFLLTNDLTNFIVEIAHPNLQAGSSLNKVASAHAPCPTHTLLAHASGGTAILSAIRNQRTLRGGECVLKPSIAEAVSVLFQYFHTWALKWHILLCKWFILVLELEWIQSTATAGSLNTWCSGCKVILLGNADPQTSHLLNMLAFDTEAQVVSDNRDRPFC